MVERKLFNCVEGKNEELFEIEHYPSMSLGLLRALRYVDHRMTVEPELMMCIVRSIHDDVCCRNAANRLIHWNEAIRTGHEIDSTATNDMLHEIFSALITGNLQDNPYQSIDDISAVLRAFDLECERLGDCFD
jgi:hypothetical protein